MLWHTHRAAAALFTLVAACCIGGLIPPAARAQSSSTALGRKTMSAGTYVEKKSNARHTWQVNGAHTLLWDGAPYLPVGGAFAPKSFASNAEAAWQQDVAALNTLKARGIRDLIIWPETSLPDVPAASLQRLIDFLDANEFRYGLSFGLGMTEPLSGYLVRPSQYRFEDPHGLTALWPVTNVDRAFYFIVDAGNDAHFVRGEEAPLHDGVASAPLDVPDTVARPVALLLPHKILTPGAQGSLPDLWNRFDGYRDRLLSYLEPIKFGAGLRFFIDPLARHLGLTQDADALIPDSDAFRLEWESYLNKTYANPDEIRTRWLLTDNFKTVQELARLTPLWSRERGLPFLFDPVNGRVFRTQQSDALYSYWWNDFRQWRSQSVAYYMNGMADTLKHQVADVPVVYTWTASEPFFAGSDPAAGFDGLAIATEAQDPHRLARITGPTYSMAEQSQRAMWLIASEIRPKTPPSAARGGAGQTSAPAPTGLVAATGYNNAREMENDLTDLRRIGFKGMFVQALQPATGQTATPTGGDWLSAAESLDWLHSFAAGLTADAGVANFTPRALYYPQAAPGPARTILIPGTSGVYWLPAAISGKPLTLWPTFEGYTMQADPDKPEEVVLVSISGVRRTRIFAPDITKVSARSAEGTAIPLKVLTKNSAEVTIDTTPMIFTANGQELSVEAAVKDAIDQLELLEAMAHLADQNSITRGQDVLSDVELKQAMMWYKQKNYGTSYAAARQMIDRMVDVVRPYIWLEGEASTGQNFTEIAVHPEASGGGYLRLSTPNPPPRYPVPVYGALYLFDAPNDDDYNIWIAATVPGPETSPIVWYIDRQPEQEPASTTPQGPLYLQDRLGWYQLGKVRLSKGSHRLSIKVTDRAAATNLYSFSIDAVLIMPARRDFASDATIKPVPIDPDSARLFLKNHAPKPGKQSKQQ
jgi:hypothetical protein